MDCIEFNDRFRYCDTASDMGFLLMDLDFQGYPGLGRRVAGRYAQSSGDEDILKLLGFYKSYRAFVRGKVIGFTLDEEEVSQEEKESAARTAGDYFRLSVASLRPPPHPALIITAGLTGTGKSYLAMRLGKRLGTEPVRSDVVRKEIMGEVGLEHRLDKYGEGIYTPRATDLTYRALLDRARRSLEGGASVILDASFARLEHRMQAREAAAEAGARFRLVLCTAPDEVVRRRLGDRITLREDPSDGRWEIFVEQKKRFDPLGPRERDHAWTWDSTTSIASFLAGFVRSLLG
ncbi:MAG: AAA family ATPase [Deltaproteobacteria bacterium]|nr:AAA family ATPase [Deltaproteobacteria bacterium]